MRPAREQGRWVETPEIKWRVEPEDLLRFQKRQAAILGRALDQLEPGGKLVYATCSLEEEENEDVVRAVVRKRREIRILKESGAYQDANRVTDSSLPC